MKIFNLTDVTTKTLQQRHAVGQTYVIGGKPIAPGASVEYPEGSRLVLTRESAHLTNIGALAIDKLPDEYLKAKPSANAPKAAAPVEAASPTPVAASAAEAPPPDADVAESPKKKKG